MPPKKSYGRQDSDDEDSSSEETSSEESTHDSPPKQSQQQQQQRRPSGPEAQQQHGGAGGRGIANKPHDEEFDVDEGHRRTPPESQRKPVPVTQTITPAAAKASGSFLRNNPNDETFDVDDDRPVKTPPRRGSDSGQQQQQQQRGGAPGGKRGAAPGAGGSLRNDAHDEFEDVEDDMAHSETPRQQQAKPSAAASKQQQQAPLQPGRGGMSLQNDHHDEAIDVSDHSPASTRGSATPQSSKKAQPKQIQPVAKVAAAAGSMMHRGGGGGDDSESSTDDESPKGGKIKEISGSATGAMATKAPPPSLDYNPADYAHLNARASREVQELFTYITAYQPVVQELPSKLRPFIPDFIPCVGDLDPFCKVPRPDGRPDHLGLHVVDEPCANQSNPAVVKIGLQYISKQQNPAEFVDSVEDAAKKSAVIDKWVSDIKKLHYKKPLPTVNYSKPMPEIEALLQVWPQEFEDVLNSDLQFPPTQVDLDIDQYVRVMCAILDIPTYGSLIESLHVMFTLYAEFRANQHFQHA